MIYINEVNIYFGNNKITQLFKTLIFCINEDNVYSFKSEFTKPLKKLWLEMAQ